MKTWKFLILLLTLCVMSCSRNFGLEEEPLPSPEGGVVDGARVRVVVSLVGAEPATKALGEGGELQTLHLAVFGGSGYLKEYVQAVPSASGTYTYSTVDAYGDPVDRTVPRYDFTVDLAMSDSPRTIHLLGNGPSTLQFGYDTAVMPSQLSAGGEMGYWQMITLPNGIRAKRNDNGDYVDIEGNVIPDGGSGYIADAATELCFQGIPLIRNWAKIVLSAADESNFTPVSFAAVNIPSRGTMAPYSASTGFISHYEQLSFTYLEDEVEYPANLPAGTTFDESIPDAADFTAPFGARVASADGGATYLYERPAPSSNIQPSFVIIYGYYDNPDDQAHKGYYFYKVDLMETKRIGEEFQSRYYPIFRNFKYQIVVKKILSQGHPTPQAAAASAGSADVSADISTQHLGDISDGIGRLHVMPWMSQTFTREHGAGNPVDVLSAWFGSTDGEPFLDNGRVKVQLLPPEDGGNDIIYNLTLYPAEQEGEEKGWRKIIFYNVAPGKTVRTQKIRITGLHDDGRLYRDIPITIQPIQPMSVRCGESRIPAVKGTSQTVTIDIPDGLVQSMFPLEFTIEADHKTLTPDNSVPNNNLPLVNGPSISGNLYYADKMSYQFVRTITWDEYLSLERSEDENERVWRSFTCYFKTNCDESASDVWVSNEFFEKGNDSFVHFFYKTFNNCGFTVPIPSAEDVSLPMSFEMMEDIDGIYPADYPYVLIKTQGVRLDLGGNITAGPDPGTYYVKPAGHTVTLNFISTTADPAEISVELSAIDYSRATIVPYEFPFAGFIDGHSLSNSSGKWSNNTWSNVAWGHINSDNNKTLIFAYKDHPDKLNTPVTLTIENGFKNGVDNKPLVFPMTPTGPRHPSGDINYHEIEAKTVGGRQDVVFSLSSPGYLTKYFRYGRFSGNIRTMKITNSNVIKPTNTYGFTPANPSFNYTEDNGSVRVEFSEVTNIANDRIVFATGKPYTMTITSRNSNQTLFYVNIIFSDRSGYIFKPENFEPSVGEIERYPGTNNQFVWHIPRGNLSASLTFTPQTNLDTEITNIFIKSFNGSLLENGVTIP